MKKLIFEEHSLENMRINSRDITVGGIHVHVSSSSCELLDIDGGMIPEE